MNVPFSSDQFFAMLASYNTDVWPVQGFLLVLAFAIAAATLKDTPTRGKLVSSLLAFLWVWMAVAYHWRFFSEIHPFARVFAGLFTLQGMLLLAFGLRPDGLRFRPRGDLFGVAGGFLVTYALVIYPVMSMGMGRAYPSTSTFGLPCPTTIFTVGVLLWARPRAHGALLLVPAIWSVVCLAAMIEFRMVEDAMLPISVMIAGGLALLQNRRENKLKARVLGAAGVGRSRPAVRR